jgi:hypothetical protein
VDIGAEKIAEALAAASPMQGMPIWAKVIGYLGFPIVVASSLLWVFTDQIRSERALLTEHNQVMKQHANVAVQQYVNQAVVGAASLRALSQICANGAKTRDDREACATVVIPQAPVLTEAMIPVH